MFALKFPPQVPEEIFLLWFHAVVIPCADAEQRLFCLEHRKMGVHEENAVWIRIPGQIRSLYFKSSTCLSVLLGSLLLKSEQVTVGPSAQVRQVERILNLIQRSFLKECPTETAKFSTLQTFLRRVFLLSIEPDQLL